MRRIRHELGRPAQQTSRSPVRQLSRSPAQQLFCSPARQPARAATESWASERLGGWPPAGGPCPARSAVVPWSMIEISRGEFVDAVNDAQDSLHVQNDSSIATPN